MGALGSWGPWAGILWGGKQVCVGQACAQYGTLVTQQTPGKSWREGLGKKMPASSILCQEELSLII